MSTDMFPDSFIEYMLEKEKEVADHGENYKRAKGPAGEEIGKLGPECGHHCGVITVGQTDQHIGHCDGSCCHGGGAIVSELPTQFTTQNKGVDPRGIR